MQEQDVHQYGYCDMAASGLKPCQHCQGNEAIDGEIADHPGLVIIHCPEAGVEVYRVHKQQRHQYNADDYTVVVIDPKQPAPLV